MCLAAADLIGNLSAILLSLQSCCLCFAQQGWTHSNNIYGIEAINGATSGLPSRFDEVYVCLIGDVLLSLGINRQ